MAKWVITDSGTGETTEHATNINMSASIADGVVHDLKEVAAAINDDVMAEECFEYGDFPSGEWGSVWTSWGYTPVAWNQETGVLTAHATEGGYWDPECVLTATLVH